MRTSDLNWPNEGGRVHNPSDLNTPAGLAIRWLEHLEVDRGRSPETIRRYDLTVEQWLNWAATSQVDPLLPSLEELEEFIRRPRLRQGHGRLGAPATRRAEVTHLRGWFRWMTARKLVAVDPTVAMVAPTVKAGLPKPIPDDHWLVLWEGQTTHRLHLALGLGYYVGLRRAEICALQGHQLEDHLIANFVRKGGGEDTLPWRQMLSVYQEELPRLAVGSDVWAQELLDHASSHRHSVLFWNEGQTMYKEMKRACKRLGLPHYTPHQLRHSCATNLFRASMPMGLVSSLMNHSSLDITKGYMRAGGAELAEWRKGRRLGLRGGD